MNKAILVTEKNKSKKRTAYDYDAIVIGTGPGGEGAAMNLAKSGKSVAVVPSLSKKPLHC